MQEHFADAYSGYEEDHWWFRARRHILRRLIRRLDLPSQPHILEIGTGPGANLYSIYPEGAVLTGMDPDASQTARARKKGNAPVHTAAAEDAHTLLHGKSFACITMLDVLEHTKDDMHVLTIARNLLAPDGLLILTVPAFMFLWGPQDIVSGHHRRYTLRSLTAKLKKAGFVIQRATYFNTFLFLPIALFRILRRWLRSPTRNTASDFTLSLGRWDNLLYGIFRAEAWFLPHVNLPVGVSIFVVATKSAR